MEGRLPRRMIVFAGTAVIAACVAQLAFTVPNVHAAVRVASKKPGTPATTIRGIPAPSKDAVAVTFDNPGSAPRPIKEKVLAIRSPRSSFSMIVAKVSYPGLVCGFTFKGVRPPGPATIRITGMGKTGRFDSGELRVTWDANSKQETSSASSGDAASGWSFLSAANVDRSTNAGWVVSAGAVPQDKSNLPTSVVCAMKTTTPVAATSGPVGYWAGFATA